MSGHAFACRNRGSVTFRGGLVVKRGGHKYPLGVDAGMASGEGRAELSAVQRRKAVMVVRKPGHILAIRCVRKPEPALTKNTVPKQLTP